MVQSLVSTVQGPESRVQRLECSFQQSRPKPRNSGMPVHSPFLIFHTVVYEAIVVSAEVIALNRIFQIFTVSLDFC